MFKRFTERARQVVVLAQHNYIGTEHILLGVVRENEGVAARILLYIGASAEKIRNAVLEMLEGPPPPRRATAQAVGVESLQRQTALRDRVTGWLLFAVALGIGLLLGWLIWG